MKVYFDRFDNDGGSTLLWDIVLDAVGACAEMKVRYILH